MGEFTQTPEYTPRVHMQSDSEPKDVDTSTAADAGTETTDTAATTGDKTGAEAAQDQGAQTSQQTSADVEGADKKPEPEPEPKAEKPKKQYATDVPDVKCDDQVRIGADKFPCFDVTQDEFYQNMQDGRRRLRFSKGSNCQKYMQGTKYNRPFFIRHTDTKGKTYVRKIK